MFIKIFRLLKWSIIKIFSSLTMRLILIFQGITFGKKISFLGLSTFTVNRGSKITIGNDCSFKSIPDSNLIGINRQCMISSIGTNSELTIYNNVGMSGVTIGCFNKITIEENVKIGANSVITDGDWHPEDSRSGFSKPIHIGKNVWIGVNTIILKGVSIGDNSVIGAGSVVTHNVPANVVAAGNPCRVLKNIK